MPDTQTAIDVDTARTHNLKGIDCRVPHGKVTVVTGPSGAGKSSLAFNTVYAEGQRRFVESMSTYARQFLEQMERPPVDDVRHVLPSVALEAKNSITNARSTVGTITEAYDVLRLLFTHLGDVACPNGHGDVRRWLPEDVAVDAASGAVGERFLVVARVARPKKNANDALSQLVRQGFLRRLDEDGDGDGGDVEKMVPSTRWLTRWDPLPIVLGRFKAGATEARLVSTLEDAYRLGRGTLRTGFQSLSALKAQREVYAALGTEDLLDVHVYGERDWSPDVPGVHAVSVGDAGDATDETSDPGRTGEIGEIGAFWFVVFDGGGDDQQACALVAEEDDPDVEAFHGFWTYDAELVGDIDAYLEETYGDG